jgi:hypothetical protein
LSAPIETADEFTLCLRKLATRAALSVFPPATTDNVVNLAAERQPTTHWLRENGYLPPTVTDRHGVTSR